MENFFVEMVFHVIYSNDRPANYLERGYYNYYESYEEAYDKIKELIAEDRIQEDYLYFYKMEMRYCDYAYVRLYNSDGTLFKATIKLPS